MPSVQTLTETLRDAEIFARLSPEQLSKVAAKARAIRLAADETLFSQGGPADCFFYLVAGQLKLYRLSPEGHEKVIEVIEPGTTFAETRVFLENPKYHVSCAALADSEIIGIDSRNFRAVLREPPESCRVRPAEPSRPLEGLITQGALPEPMRNAMRTVFIEPHRFSASRDLHQTRKLHRQLARQAWQER